MAIAFYFSGFSALVYQVVWQRVLTQVIGVDAVSVAFIVRTYFDYDLFPDHGHKIEVKLAEHLSMISGHKGWQAKLR